MQRVVFASLAIAILALWRVETRQSQHATVSVADARGLGIRWARIPAGTFQMGCVQGDKECDSDELPRHQVTLTKDYWLMTTEVTIEMFRPYSSQGHPMPLQPDWNVNPRQPIVQVSWDGASGFCEWLDGRLPTEAEFEHAARAGIDGAKYEWGNEPLPLPKGVRPPANVADESTKKKYPSFAVFVGFDDGFPWTAPVGSFAPNAFGVYDMTGNVAEWVADRYTDKYPADPILDPHVVQSPYTNGVVRGGSWRRAPRFERLSQRMGYPRQSRPDEFGFRCAKNVAVGK